MRIYDTVIIGAGASGLLAGIYLNGTDSLILEKNSIPGRKLLITGGGRCNITNRSSVGRYVESYYNTGNYYRQAFATFFHDDIIRLLEDNGCMTKTEQNNEVFPVSDKSRSVVDTLTGILKTPVRLNCHVKSISKCENGIFCIKYNDDGKVYAYNVILAAGSSAYPETGSDGDGEKLAVSLGHTPSETVYGLAPVVIKQEWIKQLQGITVNAVAEFKADNRRVIKDEGPVLFTHYGVSGHTILNNSMKINENRNRNRNVTLHLDFAGEYSYETLDRTLRCDFKKNTNRTLKTYLHKYLPRRMTTVILGQLGIDPAKILNQVTRGERSKIIQALKNTVLDVEGIKKNDAMVQNSGVLQKEIDPNTCRSRIVENLYITGELIEGCGICGGFNLQKAFSTGVLAARSIKEDRQ